MQFKQLLSCLVVSVATVFAEEETTANTTAIPAEAIIGYMALGADKDIGIIPFGNATSNGLMFINTTIAKEAALSGESENLAKREADAWHWLELDWGQPLYKREADAEAKAAPWHWLELDWGQPLYKREADADADASAWHWLELDWGQPLY